MPTTSCSSPSASCQAVADSVANLNPHKQPPLKARPPLSLRESSPASLHALPRARGRSVCDSRRLRMHRWKAQSQRSLASRCLGAEAWTNSSKAVLGLFAGFGSVQAMRRVSIVSTLAAGARRLGSPSPHAGGRTVEWGALSSYIPEWLAGTPSATAGSDEARIQPSFVQCQQLVVLGRRLVSCLARSPAGAAPATGHRDCEI